MSQAELAQKMGVKPQTISQYERGIKNPKPATIKKFADALGVDAAVLYAISTEQRDARVFKQLGIKPAELAEATEQADSEIAEPAFLQVLKGYMTQQKDSACRHFQQRNLLFQI